MAPWIQVYSNTMDNHKTYALADKLNIPQYAAMGLMVSLWSWVAVNAPNGDISGYGARAIADACRWTKKPLALLNAFVESGLIDADENGMYIHDWAEYAELLVDAADRQREKARERVRRYRERQNVKNNEKSPEDVTPCNADVTSECNADVTLQEKNVTLQKRDVTPLPNLTLPNLTIPNHTLPAAVANAPAAEATAAAKNNDGVRETYENAIGEWSAHTEKTLYSYGLPPEVIIYAINEAGDHGAGLKYIRSILDRCQRQGINNATLARARPEKSKLDAQAVEEMRLRLGSEQKGGHNL